MKTFARTMDHGTIDAINSSIEAVAQDSESFHQIALPHPSGFRVMDSNSYVEVEAALSKQCNRLVLGTAFEDDSIANRPIAAVPYALRFPSPNSKSDKSIKQTVADFGHTSLRGIRKVMFGIRPVSEKEFCPPEFEHAASELGAWKFYDNPSYMTLGWVDMKLTDIPRQRDELLEAIFSVSPYMLLSGITVEDV